METKNESLIELGVFYYQLIFMLKINLIRVEAGSWIK